MRVVMLGLVIGLALPGAASAQWPQPAQRPPMTYGYGSYGQAPAPLPTPRTTYDYQSGSVYHTTPTYGGGATIRGSNTYTGSTWTTQVQPNGNMTGTDANGNLWQYNSATGNYISSDGTVCMGKGALRQCF